MYLSVGIICLVAPERNRRDAVKRIKKRLYHLDYFITRESQHLASPLKLEMTRPYSCLREFSTQIIPKYMLPVLYSLHRVPYHHLGQSIWSPPATKLHRSRGSAAAVATRKAALHTLGWQGNS